jgi:L,D-transpeptidase YcbB
VRLKIWIAAVLVALAGCTVQKAGPPEATAELRAAATGEQAKRFYQARGWALAWTGEGSARALEDAIGEAERHGLDPESLRPRIANGASPAARDAALTQAALTYAEALARGRTDPARLRAIYEIPRPNPDLAAGLARALEGNNLQDWLERLAPQDDDYRALSGAYLEARRRIAAANGRPAPALLADAVTLAVNLERRRWLEREPPATRIDVDTGAAMLFYIRDNQIADSRRVVVGQPGNETPSLASPMVRLVANPTWTVPTSIQRNEIEPRGRGYMARNNMEYRGRAIVQASGPRNSLGLVKFDMRNTHAIYLHDTPAKGLFGADERHRSHGCVRVMDALGFAQLIARDEGVLDQWTRAQRRERNEEGEEQYEERAIDLPRPIPVRLLYHTAHVENGRVVITRDAYGWDEAVARALGLPAGARRAARARYNDIGP